MDLNSTIASMTGGDQPSTEVDYDFAPFLRTYKDGHIERLLGTDVLPPSPTDPTSGVLSKDVTINPTTNLSARLYIPSNVPAGEKLPVLVYYHGGGFCVESPFSPTYHPYLNSLVSASNVVAVSVHYRLAPEQPLPAAYHDSWEALRWVVSAPDTWLKDHGDFNHVFLAGDSAGANICHWVAMKGGEEPLPESREIEGVVLVHSYFWGKDPIGSEPTDPVIREKMASSWEFLCPGTPVGLDNPWVNPVAGGAQDLAKLACKRVLVCVGETDLFKDRGVDYYEKLKGSGWGGKAELLVSEGQNHVFHLMDPKCQHAVDKMDRLVKFFRDQC